MANQALRKRPIEVENPETDSVKGRELRRSTPRSTLADLAVGKRTATDILTSQNADRLHELVPLRFARMLADPFSFYRGSAAVMAADLAAGPSSGIHVVSCGDAHISNFGIYAAPDRALVFDLNDFDETAFAPWEWDVKRLLTSAIIGGRQAGHRKKVIRGTVERAARAYQDALAEILNMNLLDRYYLRFEPELYRRKLRRDVRSVGDAAVKRAKSRTSAQAFARIMTRGDDGVLRLREDPPVLTHVDIGSEIQLIDAFREYLAAVPADIAVLLSHFNVTDLALRVVGVGSVGTRCYLAILTGPEGTPLVLQIKEANRSVLEEYGGIGQPAGLCDAVEARGQGARVVDGQRILQANSDVFLGTTRKDGHDYYVRQFRDMKGSFDTAQMSPAAFAEYVTVCAVMLARAHAQSANASMLSGYVGKSTAVRKAVIDWSYAYAEKSFDDYQLLCAAAKSGEIDIAGG